MAGDSLGKGISLKKEKEMVKILFNLEENPFGYSTETLWATPVSGRSFQLENSPFYAFGVSYLDVVKAKKSGPFFNFISVIKPSGHSTYRILMNEGQFEGNFLTIWPQISDEGCSYESTGDRRNLFSVDVPPSADIRKVYRLLEKGEEEGIWDFEEAHCGHPSVVG